MKLNLKIILQTCACIAGFIGMAYAGGENQTLGVAVRKSAGPKAPIHLAFTLHELDLDPADPERFHCRFDMEIRWNPSDYSSSTPQPFSFLNSANPLILRVKAGPVEERKIPGEKVMRYLVDGNFKAYNDYSAYPFDKHELPIIVLFPDIPRGNQQFVSHPEDLMVRVLHSSKLAGWWLDKICFYPDDTGFLHSLPCTSDGTGFSIAVFTIETHREVVHVLIRIVVPMFLIWLLSYCGFAWAQSTPTSGTAAVVAAVAFSLGTNSMHPKVEYISSLHTAFLGLYLNIIACLIFTGLIYATKTLGRDLLSKRIWVAGLVICPCLFLITVICSVYFGFHNSYCDSTYDHRPQIYHDYSHDLIMPLPSSKIPL